MTLWESGGVDLKIRCLKPVVFNEEAYLFIFFYQKFL